MNIAWNATSEYDYITTVNQNARFASMEVEGFTNDRVEVFMNLSEPGFTVVLIKGDPDSLDKTEYLNTHRETYAGALAIAVQVAASIIPVRSILTSTN